MEAIWPQKMLAESQTSTKDADMKMAMTISAILADITRYRE
jgi:hypothetical protein